ncbi:ABC transporter permease [Halorussus amylolyticus]|uniref:ABC transporter permease n=1 Tax=Halorussus amylolyticus TaxID=1126242 RepID=UPI00104D11E1|nr:ABC transporter permease [Halorussus amylolyticus]
MSSILALAKSIVRKALILRYRYFLNTAGNFAMLYLLFLLVFFGGQRFAEQAVSQSLEGIIVGVFLFSTAQVAFSRIAFDITNEAQWGTLEHLYMTPFGFDIVMLFKSIVNVLISFLFGIVLLLLMMVTSSTYLDIHPLTITVLGLLTLSSVIGLGFIIGSIAIIYKRVENMFNLMQFGFIAFLSVPIGEHVLVKALPLSFGNHLIGIALTRNLRLWELPASDLAFLTVHAVGYLLIGMGCVRFTSEVARKRGALSHY